LERLIGQVHDVNLDRQTYSETFATAGFKLNASKFLTKDGELRPDFWSGATLDETIGDLRGKLYTLGSILSSPAVSNGIVYVGSVDGNLYALGE
jgi:eukaryotic-like serine/threonine-protein kinase